jgi:hypothetical protein
MEVKEAVKRAKEVITTIFAEESVENIGLEEVEFDQSANQWLVTIGFSRPWDQSLSSAVAFLSGSVRQRTYKIVVIPDSDSDRFAVRNREQAA